MSGTAPLFLAGPTAIGKSGVALLLAEKLDGEIISVDSMQVYQGLDIGTAKPTVAERAKVPHHLIDVVPLDAPFSAAQFVSLAKAACESIQARGRVPIFCGGTGFYFKAYLEGVGEAPPASPEIRAELEQIPLPTLLIELSEKDPITFARIDKQNPRRVIRALEVIRLTGKPFSIQKAPWHREKSEPTPVTETDGSESPAFFGLERTIEDLRSRIDSRVDLMFQQGIVAETEQLLTCGLEQNKTAMQAIGYRQVVEYLRRERSLPETIAIVKQRTRQFAKRQLTWFRHQARVTWIQAAPEESLEVTAQKVLEARPVSLNRL